MLLSSLAEADGRHDDDWRWSHESRDSQRQLLSEVRALTFTQGKQTTGRRGSPLPHLTCVGGDACGEFTPLVIQCTQVGDEQWRCETDLPQHLRLGAVEVSCEGYDHPDDPYILKGSCGLEYSLHTSPGHSSSSSRSSNSYHSSSGYDSDSSPPSSSSSSSSWIPYIVMAVAGYAIYRMYLNGAFSNQPNANQQGGFGGGGGGGGAFPRGPGSGYGYGNGGCAPNPGMGMGGLGMGMGGGGGGWGRFFTGMAAGGLMGALFGNRGGYAPPARHTSLFSGGSAPRASSGFRFGGGGGGGGGGMRTAVSGGGTRRR
ncbi:MAG: hypothetical protein Q8P67_02055 [archaeon]|nr:hypothetical protein [archaeon]